MTGQCFGEALDEPAAASASQDRHGGTDFGDAAIGEVRTTKIVSLVEEHSFIRDCIQMGIRAFCDYGLLTYDTAGDFERDDRRGDCEIVITTCLGVDNSAFAGALSILRASAPNVPVLVLGPPRLEPMNIAIAAGAKGYIPFTTKFDVVVEVIRVILAGGTYAPLDCLPKGSVAGETTPTEPKPQSHRMLTAREMAVVRAIRQGKSNKVIAYSLNMTESTVKVHVRHIMAKLKAKNRTEIAVLSDQIELALLDDRALN